MLEVAVSPPKRSRATTATNRPLRWTKDGRSREAVLYRLIVKQLRAHVGGSPNHAQELLIGRIAWLSVHLSHIDERAIKDGGLSPHATREYLAWSNSIAKMLGRLGLVSPKPEPSWQDLMTYHFTSPTRKLENKRRQSDDWRLLCDEIAFWRDETSANPDVEILRALRPGMVSRRRRQRT